MRRLGQDTSRRKTGGKASPFIQFLGPEDANEGKDYGGVAEPPPQVFLPDSVSQELGPKGEKLFQEILI